MIEPRDFLAGSSLRTVVLATAAEECRRQGLAHLCGRLRVDFVEDVRALRLTVRLSVRVPAPGHTQTGLAVSVTKSLDLSDLSRKQAQLVEVFAAVGSDLAGRLGAYLRAQSLDAEVTDAPPVAAGVVAVTDVPRALPIIHLRPRDTRPGPVRQAAKIAAAVTPLEPRDAPIKKPCC